MDPHVKGVRPIGARAVRFGADYVHCERGISDAERVRMVAEVQRIATEEPYGQWSLALGDRWQTFGSIEAAAAGLSDYLAGKTDIADPPPELPPRGGRAGFPQPATEHTELFRGDCTWPSCDPLRIRLGAIGPIRESPCESRARPERGRHPRRTGV